MLHLRTWLVVCAVAFSCGYFPASSAAEFPTNLPPEVQVYVDPPVLTGTIYADAAARKPLFTFKRTATVTNLTIRAVREFKYLTGELAAKEWVVYEAGKLVYYYLEEPESFVKGTVRVEKDPKKAGGRKMFFDYTQGKDRKTASESFDEFTVVNDMVGVFISSHFDALMQGKTVESRFVSVARAETIGFRFVKESEGTRRGRPVVIIRMEPSSIIVAQFCDPLRFTVEKEGKHRVLQYWGRTTPRLKRGNKWEDVDLLTVFDWEQKSAGL